MSETLGSLLREAREAKGYVLEDVERATRIRAKHLAALEAGDFDALPSETQVRGFLRNYAQFLSVDSEHVLEIYREALDQKTGRTALLPANHKRAPGATASETKQSAAPPPQLSVSQSVNHAPRVRLRGLRLLSSDVLVGGTVTLLLILLLLWGAAQMAAYLIQTPAGTAAGQTAAFDATQATLAATSPTAEATATIELPTPLAVYTGVNLIVRAEQRAWLRVTVDGVEAFAGLLPPNTSQEFTGQNVIELVTSNGQGTRVIWNGRDQGTLGELGEVIHRLWTLEGMIIPTPTAVPASTPTEDG